MLDIDSKPDGAEIAGSDLLSDGRDDAMLARQLRFLIAADYLQGKTTPTLGDAESASVVVTGIAWQGRQFINATNDPSIWEKTKRHAADMADTISVDVLAEIATAIGLQTIAA